MIVGDYIEKYWVTIYAGLFFSNSNHLHEDEACLIQYLQGKGKLSANFQSTVQASSSCRLITQSIKTTLNEKIRNGVTNDAE